MLLGTGDPRSESAVSIVLAACLVLARSLPNLAAAACNGRFQQIGQSITRLDLIGLVLDLVGVANRAIGHLDSLDSFH